MTTTAITVEHLYKVFGRNPREGVRRLKNGESRADLAPSATAAVIDASFEVKTGEIFVVMGLSGSGKSTLIRMLNGLLESTAGSIKVQGTEIIGATPVTIREVRRNHMSMVFQHFALLPHRTVLENVAFGLEIQGVDRADREARAREVLETVSLDQWADHYPNELSGGMQQRVGIARALCAETEILLMDEAFSALDPLIRREMQEELVEMQQKFGKTIVFITHDLNEAMFLGDRIAVMRDGEIVQIGSPEEILTEPANEYVEQFVQDVDRSRVLTASAVMQPARAVLPVSAGIAGVEKMMRELQINGVFLIEQGKLVGSVNEVQIGRARRSGKRDLSAIIDRDILTVEPDTVLSELFEPSVDNTMPLPVVNDAGRLLGVVPRVALLSSMTTTTGTIDLPADAGVADPQVPLELTNNEPVVEGSAAQ
ncbi:quaternary amine ABC transporter ATP-binding protein [Gulosibacter molinativorax]|uniref:Glycine betaine/L-proline ABC transporter ATP-binding protein n=1 Tax=Gulosibacter molinativorax TaxID=256821 RepID=A0ABT7CAQ1_9MICO|nr:glycine betaine/L-proline ABC transporter ATP-binding protein [Gulosibacter molinativorax]MDJ1372195.1 glycine betaine/L-proline ABC transporter ATP-binding protein [Gulosibacter molinativorax]QUY60933.1 Glycine betaine/carnitine transport ATP-binding protein GbuA [Gulosibacter molinativorax]